MDPQIVNGVISFEMPAGLSPQIENGVLFYLWASAADPSVTFDYGWYEGPVVETDKTDMESLSYGFLFGPVVGVETGTEGTTTRRDMCNLIII